MDYAEVGGAPLLGVKGVVVKAHGRSQARAITRAAQATVTLAEHKLIDRIAHEIRSVSLWKRLQMWFGKDE
jgi:glycerol-3-phosphate acyltransferase PlsX